MGAGLHVTVVETVLTTPFTVAVAVYTFVPVEDVFTVIVAMPEESVVAVKFRPASGPLLTVILTTTPACGTPAIVWAVAVIVSGVPAAGFVGLIARVKELGRLTLPPPIDTALRVSEELGNG